MSTKNPIKTLSPEVARKIAAGEVIDRPNAIVRELLDNAIDSGANFITVEITGGGIEKIRVIDNGCGMTKDDLQNCARPHATSKITKETDLLKLSTLGFRGEALASIAAVARLSIISGGWKMKASIIEDHILEPTANTQGTIVQSEGLFENIPARRQFLKRAATEGIMCKNTFIEKSIARPDIGFRFISDGITKIDLPASQTLKERFLSANQYSENKNLFYELSGKADGNTPDWNFTVVIGEPSVSRSNKKDIYIYTNGRKIQEYSLIQAVEYGGQGFFPNGTFPVALVFITVNPELVDFNIHPAKKEARFYDISDLHHGISSTIKTFFHSYTKANFDEDKPADEMREFNFFNSESDLNSPQTDSTSPQIISNPQLIQNDLELPKSEDSSFSNLTSQPYQKHITYKNSEPSAFPMNDFRSKYFGTKNSTNSTKDDLSQNIFSKNLSSFYTANTNNLAEAALNFASSTQNDENTKNYESPLENLQKNIKFIGSTLGTFLLAEKNNSLYIIDQHAAHERILFDKIMNSQGKSQSLLIPYKIKTESKSQDKQMEKLQERLTSIGFETIKKCPGEWEITTIPERWTGTQYDLQTLIFVKQVEPEQIIRSIAAMTACHAAIKDGYVIDDETAAKLVLEAFTLEDPHCPHGRPIYTVISRQKLFELVKRT